MKPPSPSIRHGASSASTGKFRQPSGRGGGLAPTNKLNEHGLVLDSGISSDSYSVLAPISSFLLAYTLSRLPYALIPFCYGGSLESGKGSPLPRTLGAME